MCTTITHWEEKQKHGIRNESPRTAFFLTLSTFSFNSRCDTKTLNVEGSTLIVERLPEKNNRERPSYSSGVRVLFIYVNLSPSFIHR